MIFSRDIHSWVRFTNPFSKNIQTLVFKKKCLRRKAEGRLQARPYFMGYTGGALWYRWGSSYLTTIGPVGGQHLRGLTVSQGIANRGKFSTLVIGPPLDPP
jgi:hypothetical protein